MIEVRILDSEQKMRKEIKWGSPKQYQHGWESESSSNPKRLPKPRSKYCKFLKGPHQYGEWKNVRFAFSPDKPTKMWERFCVRCNKKDYRYIMTKLLQFTADWCQPCKMMKPILEEIDKENPDILQRIDIEDEKNTDIVTQYGVMSIPTFIVLKDDVQTARLTGIQTKQKLEEIIK